MSIKFLSAILGLSGPKYASQKRSGLKTRFQYAIFVLKFAGPLVSNCGFDPQYASVFDRYAASTRNLLGMFRFSFNTKFGKDKKPIKIRPATQNTQRVEISIRNATRRKRSGSGPLSSGAGDGCANFMGAQNFCVLSAG